MKKIIVLFVISSLFLTSCSIFTDEETIELEFLEKHNMSVWERTAVSNPERQVIMRILRYSNNVAEKYIPIGNPECYSKFHYNSGDVQISDNTENYLKLSGTDVNGFDITFSFSIKDDVLIESFRGWNPHGGHDYTRAWAKSNMNVDDLKLCD